MPGLPAASSSNRAWTTRAFVSAGALVALFLVLAKIVVIDGHDRFDRTISLTVQSWATPHRTEIMRLITQLGASWVGVAVCGGIVLWLLWERRYATVLAIGSVFALAKLLEAGCKVAFARPRPSIVPHLTHADGYSFPSGHTITAIIVWGLLAAVLVDRTSGRAQSLPPVAAAVLVALIGFSRIYLGVHYLTDVIGGMLLGGACLALAIAALHHLDRSARNAPGRSSRARGAFRHRFAGRRTMNAVHFDEASRHTGVLEVNDTNQNR